MNSSMFATIFIVVLAVIFIFLVVMTIVMIATAGKKKAPKQKHDIHEDEKKINDLREEREEDIFADEKNEEDVATIENEEIATIESTFVKPGEDSAFAENIGADSAFFEEIGEDSAFSQSTGKPTAYEEAAATGSAFAENIGMDSAFAENVISDDTYVDNLEEDSAFNYHGEPQTKEIPLVEENVKIPVKETTMTQAMVEATERSDSELKNAIEEFLSEAEPEMEVEPEAAELEAEGNLGLDATAESKGEPKAEVDTEAAVTAGAEVAATTETGIESEAVSGVAESDITAGDVATENHTDEINLDEIGTDSAFGPEVSGVNLSDEEITASIREALNAVRAMGSIGDDANPVFGMSEELAKYGSKKKVHKKSTVASNEDFYWYNLLDVSEKPSYKTMEMYYHYFTIASDCIDDLLMEMYDCALVRTEEIRYIAYGIPPKAVSMRDILTSGNSHYIQHEKQKEPTTQDLVRIYEKWCSYVDNLFEKIEIHADEFTINEIRTRLYEFGRNDVEVILEGK